MSWKIVFKLSLKHLLAKKLRSIVTIGGMAIGVSVVVFLLSFGFGMQKLVTDQLVNLKSINTIQVTSQKSKILTLNPTEVGFLKAVTKVTEVVGLYNIAGKMTFGNSTTDVVVYGTTKRYFELTDLKTSNGQGLSADYNDKTLEAVVNTVALETLGIKNKKDALGKPISLKIIANKDLALLGNKTTAQFKIVGVVDDSAGSFVYVPEQFLKDLGLKSYYQAIVAVKDRNDIPNVRREIENRGFTTASALDTLNQINTVFRWFNLFLAVVGGFGLLIAAGGMFNTLTVSLLERTKEIGLMKILGARQKDILRLFLVEATLMTFFGGVIGISIAFSLGVVINYGINLIGKAKGADYVSLFTIPLLFALFIIGLSLLLGVITAIFPARRGSLINPLHALKRE